MNNNDHSRPIKTLLDKVENYGKINLELLKMNVIDKSADLVSFLIARLVNFMVLVLFSLIINIGIALWLGDLLGELYYGFFAVAAFYFLLGALLYFFGHAWIKLPISNSIIIQMLKQKK